MERVWDLINYGMDAKVKDHEEYTAFDGKSWPPIKVELHQIPKTHSATITRDEGDGVPEPERFELE